MTEPQGVLVPTLGDPDDEAALEHALDTFPEATVCLLAVVEPLDQPVSEGRVLDRGDERLADARERAESLRESAGDPSRVTIDTREGSPSAIVPTYAANNAIDHIVVAGHDTTGIVRRLLGTGIPRTIEERSPVPVTVLE